MSDHRRVRLLLLVLVICLLASDLLPCAVAQSPCGAWQRSRWDDRIQLTQVGESVGGECRGVFVLSAETQGAGRANYTLELRPSTLSNARVEWISEDAEAGEQATLLVPGLEVELHAFPVDGYSPAEIWVDGEMTAASVAVDTTGFLLRTMLAVTAGGSCVVSDDQLARTATDMSSMVEPALRLLWDGDLVGAKGALSALLPGMLEQSSGMLEANDVACAAESLAAAAEQRAVLQRLETEFLAWLSMAVYDYFGYQEQPALISLEYAAPAEVTPRSPTSTSESLSPSEQEVLEVLRRYEEIRIRSHGPSHDITGLEEVLAESSLQSHLDSVAWQRENNAYYVITVHASNVEEIIVVSPTRIDVLVDKIESREFYIDGELGTRNTVYDDHYQVRYQFKQIDGSWYIVDRSVITPTAEAPTATPSATMPKCSVSPARALAAAWDRDELGCATGPSSVVWAAWEPFERGYLLWRQDTNKVYVLYFANGTNRSAGDWELRHEVWDESDPGGIGLSPPTGLVEPVRGFGWLWRNYLGGVQGRLGWAKEQEKGFCVAVQSFESGLIFGSSTVQDCYEQLFNWATHPSFTSLLFVLRGDGTWQRY